MRYCVIKGTTKIIDGSNNSFEFMLQNAKNAGFSEEDIEILSEEAYEAIKPEVPKDSQFPTREERLTMLENAVLTLMME